MRSLTEKIIMKYYKEGTHQRLGQYFCNTYVKAESGATLGIFNEHNFNKARVLIHQFVTNSQWAKLPCKLVPDQRTASRFINMET